VKLNQIFHPRRPARCPALLGHADRLAVPGAGRRAAIGAASGALGGAMTDLASTTAS